MEHNTVAAKLKKASKQHHSGFMAKKVIGRVADNGRVAWHVVGTNGKSKKLAASSLSRRSMAEAVEVYGVALKRLADR